MTEQEIALKRFEADGKGTTTDRKKPHKNWDDIIKKGRAAEREKAKKDKSK